MPYKMQRYHVIKDPVHSTMQFSNNENSWIKPFIDSPLFQRLRHIKQMGMGDLIFPGSVHTRFSHSIGCCYVACQIVEKLNLKTTEKQLVMLACLLHDIGHGPFSHVFENLFYKQAIRHEQWTPYLLETFNTKLFFNQYNSKNPLYTLNENKFAQICRMIMHKETSNMLLADIVSSQLDADRLDYLLRDNHFCGVTYGEYDLSWMLNSMAAIKTNCGMRLGIHQKGIGVVEHYLMARRLMIKNIYHNKKKLALEFFLIKLLIALAKSLDPNEKDHLPEFKSISTTLIGEFLIDTNKFNLQVAQPEADIKSIRDSFLRKQYKKYSKLCDYDIFMVLRILAEINQPHTAIKLARKILHREIPKLVNIEKTKINYTCKRVAEFHQRYKTKFSTWQLALIQSPHYSYEKQADPILVINDNKVITPIEVKSSLINDVSQHTEKTVFLCIDNKIAHSAEIKQLLREI